MWVDFLALHGERTPQRTALVLADERRRLTYAQLHHHAATQAAALARRGVTKGDRVALLATNRLEHITLFFGCARLGAIFVPLNFRLGKAELEEQLGCLEPALFFGVGPCTLAHSCPYLDLNSYDPGGDTAYPNTPIDHDDCLLMLFTSGSTGVPKGVMLTAGMLLWNTINTQTGWEMRAADVSVVHMPFFHTGGYNVTLLPLLRLGGCLVMTQFQPQTMLHLIQEEKITVFFAVPTMFRMMMEAPGFAECDFSSVRLCISGGAPCPASLLEAYRQKGIPLKQGFGLTEVGPNCFYMEDEFARHRPDSVGRPVPHAHMKLVDENGQTVPQGQVGELAVKGPIVCGGYWRNEQAFAAVFRDGYFYTGDLMRCDQQGFYYVVGRAKDMYISGGENVYPGEVVRQLVKLPQVADAQVLAVPSAKWGEVGFAFVRSEQSLELSQVRDFLNPLLSRYKHPHYLKVLAEFPLLPNNKVDSAALKRIALEVVADDR